MHRVVDRHRHRQTYTEKREGHSVGMSSQRDRLVIHVAMFGQWWSILRALAFWDAPRRRGASLFPGAVPGVYFGPVGVIHIYRYSYIYTIVRALALGDVV